MAKTFSVIVDRQINCQSDGFPTEDWLQSLTLSRLDQPEIRVAGRSQNVSVTRSLFGFYLPAFVRYLVFAVLIYVAFDKYSSLKTTCRSRNGYKL
jgi:hypothetical protein